MTRPSFWVTVVCLMVSGRKRETAAVQAKTPGSKPRGVMQVLVEESFLFLALQQEHKGWRQEDGEGKSSQFSAQCGPTV